MEKRLENLNLINNQTTIQEIDLIKKLQKYASKFGFEYNNVLELFQTNEIFRAGFSKDPSKQSFHQTLAINFIKTLENIDAQNTILLPAGGNNALYIISGQVIEGKNITTNKRPKSIDFLIKLNNKKTIYCTHKYTKESGGAQDNQLNDVLAFMENSKNLMSNDIFCLAILDGDYYINKIENINQKYKTKNCQAITINNLNEYISELSNK